MTEMKIPRYTLEELLEGSDYSQPLTAEDRAWLDAPAVGRELFATKHTFPKSLKATLSRRRQLKKGSISLSAIKSSRRKRFFFEKKKQKTFGLIRSGFKATGPE